MPGPLSSVLLGTANPAGTLSYLHSLRASTLPLSTVTFNPNHNHILTTCKAGATLWSMRKILKEIRFGEESPTVLQTTFSVEHGVYLLLFGLYRPRANHSRIHPDSCVIKVLHTNLTTLASFVPHGLAKENMTVSMCYLQEPSLICTSSAEKKVSVWELHEEDQGDDEEDEWLKQDPNYMKVLKITPVAEVDHHAEFGYARKLTSLVQNGQGYVMAEAGNTVVAWLVSRIDVRLRAIIENVAVKSLKISSLGYISGLGCLVGCSDGAVNVWKCDLEDHSVHKNKEHVCGFTAHRPTGSSVGCSSILPSVDTSVYPSCGLKGQTTVVTAGGDGYVRHWSFERSSSFANSVGEATSGASMVRAREIGSFKLQMEPKNHYVETKAERRRMKRIEENSISVDVIAASLPVGLRRMCMTVVGGLVSLVEMKTSLGKDLPMAFAGGVQALEKTMSGEVAVLEGNFVRVVEIDNFFSSTSKATSLDYEVKEGAISFSISPNFAHSRDDGLLVGYKNGEIVYKEDSWFKLGASVTGSVFTSPSRAVTVDADGCVKVWNAKRGSVVSSVQGHAGPIVAISTGGGFVVTAGKGGVVKVWDIQSKSGDLVAFFVTNADISCATVVKKGVVGVGFDSGIVQGWLVGISSGKGVLKSEGTYSVAKISSMDSFDGILSEGVVAASSLDCSVMLFLGTLGGLRPFRRITSRLPLECVRLVESRQKKLYVIASSGRVLIKVRALMDDPVEEEEAKEEEIFNETFLDDLSSSQDETHTPVLLTAADQKKYAKVSDFLKDNRGVSSYDGAPLEKRAKKSKVDTSYDEAFDKPWSAEDDVELLAEGRSTTRCQGRASQSASSVRLSPNNQHVVLTSPLREGMSKSPLPSRPASPSTSLLNQSISLPSLVASDAKEKGDPSGASVTSDKSFDVNLSMASVSSGVSKPLSLTEVRRAKAAARKAEIKKPRRKRIPDWSTLRRDPRLKSAFDANDPYHTGRMSADFIPMIMRWWWPEVCDNENGDEVIARAMDRAKVGIENNLTLAQTAQIAAAICKEKNSRPTIPPQSADTNFKSPVKKRRRKYKDMQKHIVKTVFNAVGEPQRVRVNVMEDTTLPPNPKSTLTTEQRRFNSMLKIQKGAQTQIPAGSVYAPYTSKTLFQHPSVLSVPSTFLPFWKSQLSLSETRKLTANKPVGPNDEELEGSVSCVVEPKETFVEESQEAPSFLASMYGKPEKPDRVKTPPPKKHIVQKPRAMDLNKTVRLVRQLLDIKTEADKEANLHMFTRLPLPKVIYTHYIQQFGFANLAENRLTLLFDALSINFDGSSILRVFSRILNLYGEMHDPPLNKCFLPQDLEGMLYEMRQFVQERDFVVDGVLVPSEIKGTGGFRGGGRNEVRSQCITRRNMELCFRSTVSALGRHFSPSCILAVGQIILDMPDINVAGAETFVESSSFDITSFNLGSSLDSFESGVGSTPIVSQFQNVPPLVNFDGLIDLEDTFEVILLEVQRWDMECKRISDAVFGPAALPEHVVLAKSRDISRHSSMDEDRPAAAAPSMTPEDEPDLVIKGDVDNSIEDWKDKILSSFSAIRTLSASFILYDDQRTGCVPLKYFSEICRNGGGGAWRPWSIPPLYAHSLQTHPPPGTPGTNLGENPLEAVVPHPNDDEPLCEEEIALQGIIKTYFDPIEGSVCFLDFIGMLYSSALENGKLPPFAKLLAESRVEHRGLDSNTAKLIVDFMGSIRLIEASSMFNVGGVTMGASTHMLVNESLDKDVNFRSIVVGGGEEFTRELSEGWSVQEDEKRPGESIVEVTVSAPPSRSTAKNSQASRRFGTNEEYQVVAKIASESRARSRGASRSKIGSLSAQAQTMSRSGTAGGGPGTTGNTPMDTAAGGLESFWSGASDFQTLPGGIGVEAGPSAYSDFGFAPVEPDDISLGAGAVAKRMNSLDATRPKTALSQHDLTGDNMIVRTSIHKHEDPAVPSLSRMLQYSTKVVRKIPGAHIIPDDATVNLASKTSPVRKFQKELVRVMSSPGGKRLLSSSNATRKRKSRGWSSRPGTIGQRTEGTNIYIRFPGVEPLVTPISGVGSKAAHISPKKKANDYVDVGLLFDESAVGRYDVFGRPLSPLKGLTHAELEAERLRLLAEAEARRLRAELEAERLRRIEEERLRRLAEEDEERRRKEEEEKRRLMEKKLRQEEEFRRKREEAERLRREELERLAAEEAERQRILAEKLAAEEAARLAREEAARKRREAEEARLAALKAKEEEEAKAATVIQTRHRAKLSWLRFCFIKKKKKENQEVKASVTMQRIQRGREARKKVAMMKQEKKVMTENKSAAMMQKVERGRQARKMYKARLFQVKHQEETNASVVLQSKVRQREAKKQVAKKRDERRKFLKAERAREAKERRRMGKCDFDADKVGWEFDNDRWSMLNRPLSYTELKAQEISTRKRVKIVEKNLVRVEGKFDEDGNVYREGKWYGSDIVFNAAGVKGMVGGSGADVAEGEYREDNIEDLPPKELKEAQMTVPSDLSFLYDLQQSYDHKEWPPVWLTDTWDWEGHMKTVEKAIGIGSKRPPPRKRLVATYTNHLMDNEGLEKLDNRSIDEVSYYSHTRYPVISLMGEKRRVVISIDKGTFVYLQVPVVDKECTVEIKVSDFVDGAVRTDQGGCDTMLYVSENSLPTYFTYGFKDDRIPRHLTLFPNDRKVLNEEEGKAQGTGSLFIGCYNEEGGKAMVEVEVKSEADEPSAAMLNIEERVEYLHALSNHGSGELVSKFQDISSIAASTVKREVSERRELRKKGCLKTHDATLHLLAEGSEALLEQEKLKQHEKKAKREIAVEGLVGIYQDGIKVTALDLDAGDSRISKGIDSSGSEYYEVDPSASRGRTAAEERTGLRLGSDIDRYSFEDIIDYVKMDEANKRMARERKHRGTGVLGRGESLGGESSIESLGEEKKAEDIEALQRTLDMWVLEPAGGLLRPSTIGGEAIRPRTGGAARPRTGGRPRRSSSSSFKRPEDLGHLKPLVYSLTQVKGIEKSWKRTKSDERRMEGYN